ncbi:hypothetical protein VSX64_14495 [Aurantimonas sp. C2-6-R+9]|uniref:hypothetical protein n=1 Tax=unclassified Aurantimonas TaxID=2638230 RepID=UPI002E18B1F4|nr:MULTISPECIES: hypothetical protein [unclassified Aurantimonas]MEC5291965.1 hypothetical protein [Aurantimonas sp. C2-3-R2]MEC5382077.1 hypothetical protein [Aurantimonas sp. C2-6-R+9]MEC5413051.1 hypothetical protein [Aurantimonas sp. C2-4-R8]
MSGSDRARELHNNHTNKRGRVVERDGANRRVRVQFPDEDETSSYWIDVVGSGSSKNASYDMPDEDDEVWCALDPAGEGGYVAGTRYNRADRPKTSDANVTRKDFRDGSFDEHDPGSGTRTIEISGTLILKVGASTITITSGEITIATPKLTGVKT